EDFEGGAEGAIDLARGAGGADQHPALRDVGDVEAVAREPALDLADLRAPRRVARAELSGAEVVPVVRARRVGHRAVEAREPRLVAPPQGHGEVDASAGVGD